MKRQILTILFITMLFVTSLFALNIQTTKASYPETINKATIAYGDISDSDILFLKSHFDLVMGQIEPTDVAALKTGTSMQVYYYKDMQYMKTTYPDWNIVYANPTWFLKDSNGDYIYNNYWGTYLMNISNSGWQQHYIDTVNNIVVSDGYTGIFVDDVWYAIEPYEANFNSTVPALYEINFNSYMVLALIHFGEDISAPSIINSDEMDTDNYLSISGIDGQCIEGFMHPNWYSYSETLYMDHYANLGEALHRKSETGKIMYCISGLDPMDNPTEVSSMLTWCYNSFVANSTNLADSYFEFGTIENSDGSRGYYSLMDTDLGLEATPTPSITPTPTPSATPTITPTPTPTPYVSPVPSSTSAPTSTPYISTAQAATNQVFTNVYLALGIAVVSTLIAGCYIIISAFNTGNGNARFGVGLVIVSIIEVVIGVVVVSAFQGSMGTVSIVLSILKGIT